ncbi:MAG: extracellular solute-binding protein [Actinomycetaceae bacterium]|nr:extracellular solute-binding protein [Actinomycetaceae bacterium]
MVKQPRHLFATGAIIAAAALGLTACGGGEKKADAPSKDEKVTINYVHRLPDGDGMQKVEDIVKKWNTEHPNVQVKTEKFAGKPGELIKKLETDVKAGNAPCLAQIGYSEVPEVFNKSLVEDVTSEAQKYEKNYTGAFAGMKVGNKIVGLPQDTGPLVYFYDKAAFDTLGLKVPTTLDELKAAAKKAAEKGKYILDFEPDEGSLWLVSQAAGAGDSWYGVEGDKWQVNTAGEGSQKIAAFWQDALDNNYALKIPRWDDAYGKALQEGKLIGNIGAAWEAGFMLDDVVKEGQQGTWQVAALPNLGADKTGADGGSGVAVIKGCKYSAQAMEFNNWFNTQTEALASQGLIVAAKGSVATPEKIKKQFGGQDVYKVLAAANEKISPDFMVIPGFSAVDTKMKEVAGKVAEGKAKVADIFKAAGETSVQTLESLKLPVAK